MVISARLRLDPGYVSIPAPQVGAHYLASDGWGEMTITWNNAPTGFDSTATDTVTVNITESFWTVTEDVDDVYQGDGIYSVVMKLSDETSNTATSCSSSEAIVSDWRPYLEVEYGDQKYGGGTGEPNNPYRIETPNDLNDIGNHPEDFNDCFILVSDINMDGFTYTTAVIAPDINNSNYGFDGIALTGVFDGNDHKVINLTINDGEAGNDYLGLFGYIDDGEVRNLGLEGGSVSGHASVGGLCGLNGGTISNCYSTGDVNGVTTHVGGLVGWNEYGCVSNCYSTGDVKGDDCIGGLVGWNNGSVSNCHSTGDVNGIGWVGGLVGENWAGSISNCYSTGNVTGGVYVGGLVGWNDGGVSKCCFTGSVSGEFSVGGLIGSNWLAGSVSNCYSIGDVSGIDYVGGLVGWNEGGISNCFWDTDTQTHGVTYSIGDNQGTATNVAGLPTAKMKTKSTFTDAGWDFVEIWNIGENQTYPYLRVHPTGDINHDDIVNMLDFAIFAGHWLEGTGN